MYTRLLKNKSIKPTLFFGVGMFLFTIIGNAQQKWVGLNIDRNSTAYFNSLAVDTLEDKLVLGAVYLTHIGGLSSCSVIKWAPENGTEILAPNDTNILGANQIKKIIFSNDSMIVVGNNGLGIYHQNQWIYNVYEHNLHIYDIIPFHDKYLMATGPSKWFFNYIEPPRVLLWDGDTTFTEFENITDYISSGGWITTLANYKNNVVVAGNVRLFEGGIMDNIMSWNGSNWDDMDGGIHNSSGLGGLNEMIVYKNELYIGGQFVQKNHSKENHIARWDGSNWKTVGGGIIPDQRSIFSMHTHDGYLYVGGAFEGVGGIPAYSIARWDGNEWCGCGSSFDGQVMAMTHFRDTLYIAGNFNQIDGDSIAKVARFIGDNFADTCGSLTTAVRGLLPEPTFLEGYPNPAQNTFTVNLPLTQTQEIQLVVYNNLGQVVLPNQQFTANAAFSFNVSTLAKGSYIARISVAEEMYVVSFIKE